MRLYPLQGATSVQHEDHGSFDVDPDTGAVEVPAELGQHLHRQHIGGKPAWETDEERHARLVNAEIERRRDPASMFDLMQQLVDGQQANTELQAKLDEATAEIEKLRGELAAAKKAAPAKKAPAKKAAAPAAE